MAHRFTLDPYTVLGVSPDASLEELKRAFHAKSKRYHPDHGGDEWAFRLVADAYEILKTRKELGERDQAATAPRPASGFGPSNGAGPRRWTRPDPGSARHERRAEHGPADAAPDGASSRAEGGSAPRRPPDDLATVEVELIWIRLEFPEAREGAGEARTAEATLSVCMVVTWPKSSLVRHAAEYPETAETLRRVIQAFERVRGHEPQIAARSRIEDGQFVGWLSYRDVIGAQLGFENLRELLSAHGLKVRLETRTETIPGECPVLTSPEAAPRA